MADFYDLSNRIAEKIQKEPFKRVGFEDFFAVNQEALKTDTLFGVKNLKWLSDKLNEIIPHLAGTDLFLAKEFMDLHRRILQTASPYDFDSYLLFVEWNREPNKKFYVPRRGVLKQLVDSLQDLADGVLDILGISMPPGTGKTTLGIFFLTWFGGRFPDAPMLTGSHSNSFVRGTYDECLRIFDPQGEYLWSEAFPGVQVSNTKVFWPINSKKTLPNFPKNLLANFPHHTFT